MTATGIALSAPQSAPTPHPPPITPPRRATPLLHGTHAQEAASGSVVDNWLCDRCDRARDLDARIGCPCSAARRGRGRR